MLLPQLLRSISNCVIYNFTIYQQKSHIRETLNLSTDADNSTNIFFRLAPKKRLIKFILQFFFTSRRLPRFFILSKKKKKKGWSRGVWEGGGGCMQFEHLPFFRVPREGEGRPAPGSSYWGLSVALVYF